MRPAMMMTIGVLASSAHAQLGGQLFKLLPDDGAFCDTFGRSVAISGAPAKETVIVEGHWDDDNGSDSGSAYELRQWIAIHMPNRRFL